MVIGTHLLFFDWPRVEPPPFSHSPSGGRWRDLAVYLDQWRVLCGAKARGAVHTPPNPQSTPATSGPRSSMAHRPQTPPTRRRRQRAHGANSHAPWLQAPSSTPLRSGGLPLWATAPSPEPIPRGRAQPRPAKPAPKPWLTSPSVLQHNTRTKKGHESGMYHALSPAGSREPVEQQTHKLPRHPRLVIAMRCLLYEI